LIFSKTSPLKISKNHLIDYEIIKSMLGILCLGKCKYEEIENFKEDRLFKEALQLKRVPSKEILRQRIEAMNEEVNFVLREFNAHFLKKHAVLGKIEGTDFIPVDYDVTPFDNSNSKKEGVSLTYKKFEGFAPMITYIGNTGFMLNNEFREGKSHSNCKGTDDYIRNTLKLARKATPEKLLNRFDSGNDSVDNIFVLNEFDENYFLIKRNLRRESNDAYIALAKSAGCIEDNIREGKNIYYNSNIVTLRKMIDGQECTANVRQVVRLTERKVDRNGNVLLFPDEIIDVWYTNLDDCYDDKKIVQLYKDHGTCEQFHSELKTDLGVERLPSGKFPANTLILSMAILAYNILRMVGQELVDSGFLKRKRKVKRIRLRKVLQDIMYMACRYMKKYKKPTIQISKMNRFKEAFLYSYERLTLV
jgi:hypothetical protein